MPTDILGTPTVAIGIYLRVLYALQLDDVLTEEKKIRKISNLLSALKNEGIVELTKGKGVMKLTK